MKRVLVISYYWPPSAGAGVFRWLKFSKYLGEQGWEPVIYTPANPETPATDPSLLSEVPPGLEVIRRPIWEPYRFYKILTGRKAGEKVQTGFLDEHRKAGRAEKLSVWIRGNLFVPDARKYWVRPSVRFLTRWLKDNAIDAIVSTGPPHSMHLIGLGLKRRTGLPWLADFRDPWTQIDYHHSLRLGRRADRLHQRLEHRVLTTADEVVTVSPHWASDLEAIGRRPVEVVSNGYDPEDFRELPGFDHREFSITHLGAMNADRNPAGLWDVLGRLVNTDPFFRKHLQIQLIGKTDISVREALVGHGLSPFAKIIPHLPHREALGMAARSALLLLPLNNTPNVMGIAPGKLYEYLALKRPILCIGPPRGDAATIIRNTTSGAVADFDDSEGCSRALLGWAEDFGRGTLDSQSRGIEAYDRKRLTHRMAALLNGISR